MTWYVVCGMVWINGGVKGHFAVVYLADHIPTSRPAAIKILNDRAVKDTGNYLAELHLYQQLDHVNLVKMHGWWYTKDFAKIYGISLWNYLVLCFTQLQRSHKHETKPLSYTKSM
jgi:serine/threonine protein kinase